jgi:ADP-ribose pyrophosphatase
MQPWRTTARRVLLKHGPYLEVEEHTVELPDGRVIEDWPWIITPDFVNVVPVTVEGKMLCFRQTKYGVDGVSLAPVGGYIDDGEDPRGAAERELLEEMGCEAGEWVDLGMYRVGANRGIARAHFFLARDVRDAGVQPESDDLEEQERIELSLDEVSAALCRGEFKALAWVSIVALAMERLRRG